MTHRSHAREEAAERRDEQPKPPRPAGEPSWSQLAYHQHHLSREEMLARYRKARNLPDDPYDVTPRDAHAPGYRSLIGSQPRPPQRFLEAQKWHAGEEAPPVPPQKEKRGGLSLGQTFVIAALMAGISGGAVGYLNGQFGAYASSALAMFAAADEPGATPVLAVESAVAAAPPMQAARAAPAGPVGTDAPKKQIATATLHVNDVTGETQSPIPLSLHAEPAFPGGDITLKISGIPEEAYLTSGRRGEDKVWALSLAELRGVKLMVPEADRPALDLAVAAFETKTGELVAPVKTMTVALSDVVVQPVSAPPPQQGASTKTGLKQPGGMAQVAAIPEPQSIGMPRASVSEATATMLKEADGLLEKGDLAAARQAYEAAWNAGAAEGALGLARSYDPVVLSSLKIADAAPDRATALVWYEQAAEAGSPQAQSAIMRLKLKP